MVFDLLMDPGINAASQHIAPGITAFFGGCTFLDSMPWYFLVIALVTFGLHPRYGVRLTTLFGLNSGLNEAVKLACHLPRPYWISDTVTALSAHSSFGFPSGAAQSGAVLYGYIAILVRRWWMLIACILLILTTSAARIVSGIHFLLDILGGWIIGFFLLAVFLLAAPKAGAYAARLSRPARFLLFTLTALIPVLLVVPAYLSISGWQVPDAWAALALQKTGAAISPARIQFAWGSSGIIFGGLFGYEVLRYCGGWEPPADMKRRVVLAIAGIISVLAINAVLPAIWKLLGIAEALPPLSAFLSMAVATFWLIGGFTVIAARTGWQ